MKITEITKAILLFTAYLSKDADKQHKPLSLTEWNKFAKWLKDKNLNPEDFLIRDEASLLAAWNDQHISRNRLLALLERKTALAIALDKWSRAGVWIISRADNVYPKLFRDRLKNAAPNLLYGIGNPLLLQQYYVGVIGSRDAAESDLKASSDIGALVNKQMLGIVSGGAKGVDEASMMGSLNNGGQSLGILADSLIKRSASTLFREHILNGNLLLISPFNPEAGFNTGNAMARNKLIYALSEIAIVVKSDIKGGTWEGAKENLKNKWTPLWVCQSDAKGNHEIVKQGAQWLPTNNNFIVTDLIKTKSNNHTLTFDFESHSTSNNLTLDVKTSGIHKVIEEQSLKVKQSELDLFHFFLIKIYEYFKDKPATKLEITEALHLTPNQVDAWLDEGLKADFLKIQKESKNTTKYLSKSIELV